MAEAVQAGHESLDELVSRALASEEPIKEPQAEPIKPQSLLERIVLSEWTAPLSAAAIGAVFYATSPSLDISTQEGLTQLLIVGCFGYLAAELMRQDWLMRKAESVRRKTRPLPLKVLGLFSEHPEIIAGGVAAYITADLVSPMFVSMAPSDFLRHPKAIPIVLQLSAYLASMSFTLAYSAASLSFGRVFRPETAKVLFKASAAVINAWRGKHKEAASKLSQLLETQRSYSKAVELQSLAGDMQLLDGQIGCLDTYVSALSTDKTSYYGRSDWILAPFISLLRSAVGKAKKPQWAEAKDLAYITGAVHSFAAGPGKVSNLKAADTLLRAAVESCRDGLTSHIARAAFLRKTGRQASADLEVRVCTEIIMRQSNAESEFEPVTEESRNEVFFSQNMALKRNRAPEPLRGEFSLLERLRKELGQSIICPVPVYRLGDFYYLPSERGSETLLELMRQRTARFDDFAQAIMQLVKIQRVGMKLHYEGELNFNDAILRIDVSKPETLYLSNRRRKAIGQIERFNGVKLPESYKDSIVKDLAFADAELASSEIMTMYSDKGPKNWLKKVFGQIQALDFEPESLKLLPPQMELVNLLEFAEYLTPQHRQRLIDLYIKEYEAEHRVKIGRKEFSRIYEFAGLQWHYERLIYNPEEAFKARTPERREAKKKEQVYHLAKAREHLDKIIEREYLKKDDLAEALRAREELKRPLFADVSEWQRLEEIVGAEREKKLLKEPLPPGPAKLAVASYTALALSGLLISGFVAVRNNLIPFVNAPVFPQPDRILLAVSGEREITKPHRGIQEHSVLGFDYYMIDTEQDTLQFLTQADNLINSGLSKFKDKVAFVRDTNIVVYDLRTKEFKVVEDNRFENPIISPNGLWIATNLRAAYIEKNMSQLWVIRPYDLKARQITGFPNAFVSPWSGWSPDSTYLQFFSTNELSSRGGYPDNFKVWINTYNISRDEVKTGPQVANRQRYLAAWSPEGLLAYTTDDRERVYVADPQFNNPKEAYRVGNRDMLGYDTESLGKVVFAGPRHLLIASTLFNQEKAGVMFTLSVLDLKTLKLTMLDGSFVQHVSRDGSRALYSCGDFSDICELDVGTGQTRNITSTPNIREIEAVYSPNGRKIYVVAVPPVDCWEVGCAPSLFSIDLGTLESKLLKQTQNKEIAYSLVSP